MKKEEQLLLQITKEIAENITTQKTVLYDQVDWKLFLSLLKAHRIFNLVYPRTKQFIPDMDKEMYEEYHIWMKERGLLYAKELRNILTICKSIGAQPILVKGFALSQLLYGNMYARDLGDIDLLLKPEDILRVRDELFKREYLQMNHEVYRNDFYLNETGIFHEFWLKKNIDGIDVHIELKKATSAIDIRFINDFFENTQMVSMEGYKLKVNTMIFTFTQLLSNVYVNSEKKVGVRAGHRIRDFLDLYVFIRKYDKQIDWLEVLRLSKKYLMVHRVYCVLIYIKEILGLHLSADIYEMFSHENVEYSVENVTHWGTKLLWKSSMLDRLFMNEENRMSEYLSLQYERNIARAQKDITIMSISSNLLEDTKYDWIGLGNEIVFYYTFIKDKDYLYPIIKVPLKLTSVFRDYLLQFLFITDNAVFGLTVGEIKEKYVCAIQNHEYDMNLDFREEVIVKKCDTHILLKVKFPLAKLIDIGFSKNLLCYNISLYSHFDHDLRIIEKSKFCEQDDEEEIFDNLGVIDLLG